MLKKIKLGLLPQVLIAIVLGIVLGNWMPHWGIRIFVTFNDIFSQLLGFLVPLIILGLVAPAIADMGKRAGKMLLTTVAFAYVATLISGFMSYGTSVGLFPMVINTSEAANNLAQDNALTAYFSIGIPPLMSVMTALFLAFLLGLGISKITGNSLKSMLDEFKNIISLCIEKVIIPLLPLHIFGIFLNITQSGQIATMLAVFIKIIGIIFALHVVVLLLQYTIAGIVTKRNPFTLLWTMMPAYFTALGTQSSAATIPVTLQQTLKNKVNEDVADFVIPLCATIHLSGSTLKIVACAIALMMMHGTAVEPSSMIYFICMLGVVMVAAPGVPGGAIMAAVSVLQSILGFDENQIALMIALYITMDNFGTACNVTGDGAIALIIDKLLYKKEEHQK
ncbi:MAG: dicarboxylate/amino acid:cation symporter [Paludibacteraceae bacterium]|nr:dicarboxylate/amino acid:cation symporter [Paludibacteraceae bacterium]